jgi:hypothetical protein
MDYSNNNKKNETVKFIIYVALGSHNYQKPKSFYPVAREKGIPTHLPLIKV